METSGKPVKKTTLPVGVTPQMMATWEETYGKEKVKIASLPKDDESNAFLDIVVIVPSRKVLGEFEKWIDRDPNKAKEIMINACVLTSKEEVKQDDGLFYAAFDAVTQLLPIRKAIIKN